MNKDPNFSAYSAKPLDRAPTLRRRLGKLKQDAVYGVLLLPYGIYQHRRLIDSCERIDNHTYTCFFRAPTQLKALAAPVLDFLAQPGQPKRRLEILTFACSNGAEVYTMASWLLQNCPGLDFHITASDLHQEMVERCEAGRYSSAEALQSEYITAKFVEATFDRDGDSYVVKPEVRARASFSVSNLLDREGLVERFEPADVVTAQNVLFHLSPENVRRAFENLVSLMKPKSALFVEGMDLELRVELTEKFGLEPLDYQLKQIYSETRVHTPKDWWRYYWGTEPYIPLRANKKRRYATIFLKG